MQQAKTVEEAIERMDLLNAKYSDADQEEAVFLLCDVLYIAGMGDIVTAYLEARGRGIGYGQATK